MNQGVSFKFDKTELNRWKKTAGLYNKSLTELFRDAVNFYIKHQGKTTVFNQSEYAESVKRYEEGFTKITKQNELLLTKLNEANQEVKNAKEELEVNQNIAADLAAMRKLLLAIDAGNKEVKPSVIKSLEAIPKIEQSLITIYQRGGK